MEDFFASPVQFSREAWKGQDDNIHIEETLDYIALPGKANTGVAATLLICKKYRIGPFGILPQFILEKVLDFAYSPWGNLQTILQRKLIQDSDPSCEHYKSNEEAEDICMTSRDKFEKVWTFVLNVLPRLGSPLLPPGLDFQLADAHYIPDSCRHGIWRPLSENEVTLSTHVGYVSIFEVLRAACDEWESYTNQIWCTVSHCHSSDTCQIFNAHGVMRITTYSAGWEFGEVLPVSVALEFVLRMHNDGTISLSGFDLWGAFFDFEGSKCWVDGFFEVSNLARRQTGALVFSKVEPVFMEEVPCMVTQVVPSTEPAASIGEVEAAQISQHMWAGQVEQLVLRDAAATGSDTATTVLDEHRHSLGSSDDKLVLLTFSRQGETLTQTVLCSQLAERFRAARVDVRPAWAKGAVVLADGICQAALEEVPYPWNVVVRESDEADVHEVLKSLPYNLRPRLKQGCGRCFVPSDISLLADISESDPDEAASGADSSQRADVEWQGVTVRRTFLHLPPEPMCSVSSKARTV